MNKKKPKRDKLGRFLPGYSGNPKGKPPGAKHFSTLFKNAIKTLAEKKDLTPFREAIEKRFGKLPKKPETIEEYIVIVGLLKALSGNYTFYKDILDRLYGKAKDQVEIDLKAKKIEEIEEFLNQFLNEPKSQE